MPRRSAATIRPIEPDARYRNRLVQQLVNKVMSDGKKSLSERLVYDALAIVGERSGEDPVEVLESAVKALTPVLEVRSRRVGGATYQVPIEISFERQESLAIRWIVDAAGSRKGITMRDALAAEIIDAYNNTGSVVKKKEDTHKMAQANRAFAHLRW
jgi:small subunit ribosomal protein S7